MYLILINIEVINEKFEFTLTCIDLYIVLNV